MQLANQVELSGDCVPGGLPGNTVARLAEIGLSRTLARGETIFQQDSPATQVYWLISGRVRLVRSHQSGAEVLHAIMKSGDLFGDVAILARAAHSHTATCAEEGTILLLPAQGFRRVVSEDAALSSFLLQRVSSRLYEMFDLLEEHHLLDIARRLARRLLLLAQKFGAASADGVAIDLHLTHEDLAMMIGATRQSVGAHLVKWQRLGWIRQKYGRIELLDVERLRVTADSGEVM